MHPSGDDLDALARLVDGGQLKPVTDRMFPFEQIPDAFAYLEDGHAKGKVIVRSSWFAPAAALRDISIVCMAAPGLDICNEILTRCRLIPATARASGVSGQILARGDSAFGTRAVVRACRRAGAGFSLVLTKKTAVSAAIGAIPEQAWTPVRYPGAVRDPDTGAWISDAEVAEIAYTAFTSTPEAVTARLIVRRVNDARYPDALFPVWRYHPFFTDSAEPVDHADITHRQHAIIETVFADLIDGPLAHIPSGRFGANSAWVLCTAIAHNLLHAAGVLAGDRHTRARGSTLRRTIINIPARLTRPQRRPILHLPSHWPWSTPWLRLWHNTIGHSPPIAIPA
jgi:hypothetical protein